jgi:enolase
MRHDGVLAELVARALPLPPKNRLEVLHAREILDSRSRPTLAVTAVMAGRASGEAGVPSGASTGTREAVELRDGDPARFGGAGVTAAVANVNGEIAEAVCGRSFGTSPRSTRP